MSDDRRYQIFKDGPAGWSHAPADPIQLAIDPALKPTLDFVGCRADIIDLGDSTRMFFTLRHEFEHERQRACAPAAGVFVAEWRANLSAWRYVRDLPQLPARRVPAISCYFEALCTSLTATLVAYLRGPTYLVLPLLTFIPSYFAVGWIVLLGVWAAWAAVFAAVLVGSLFASAFLVRRYT